MAKKTKNTMLLYGKNSVFERLKVDPGSIKEIFLQDNFKVPRIEELISSHDIPVARLSFKDMNKIKHAKNFQGIIAKVDAFGYASFDELIELPKEKKSTVIFLDRINDPQNLGVIIRTVSCFGGFSLVIPSHEACEVNETVLHVASGGENYVKIAMLSNFSNAIIQAKEQGYWIVGAMVSDDAEDINKVALPFPLGLVIGSEGEGIRHGLKKHLDVRVMIPMQGAKLSFNVNMACVILCHEICKQRRS